MATMLRDVSLLDVLTVVGFVTAVAGTLLAAFHHYTLAATTLLVAVGVTGFTVLLVSMRLSTPR